MVERGVHRQLHRLQLQGLLVGRAPIQSIVAECVHRILFRNAFFAFHDLLHNHFYLRGHERFVFDAHSKGDRANRLRAALEFQLALKRDGQVVDVDRCLKGVVGSLDRSAADAVDQHGPLVNVGSDVARAVGASHELDADGVGDGLPLRTVVADVVIALAGAGRVLDRRHEPPQLACVRLGETKRVAVLRVGHPLTQRRVVEPGAVERRRHSRR